MSKREKNENRTGLKFHRDKEAKRKLILDTFLDLVDEIGYSLITTNKIASRADLSIGTVYRYFKNKEDILNQTFDQNIEEFDVDGQEFAKILLRRDIEATRTFVRHYLESHQKRYRGQKAYDQARAASAEIFQQYEEMIVQMVELYIEKAIENNIIEKESKETAIHALSLGIGVIETFTHKYLFQNTQFTSDNDFVEYVTSIFLFTLDYYLPKNNSNGLST